MKINSKLVLCLVYSLAIGLFLAGCQQKPSEQEQLYDQVMKIHDEVMPKMKNIRAQIKYAENTLEKAQLSTSEQQELENLKRSLLQSEDAMWEWMHTFDTERAQSDTALAYLRDEKIKIKNVSTLMLGSLEEINTFKNKLKAQSKHE